uniref:Uncharacterized protein n=1 Tax=Panagrolaimus sp. ES5 TaxID=591445 RepID=A0AC34GP26_9BILA
MVNVGHTQSYLIAGLYRLSYASGNPTTIVQHWFRSGKRLTVLIFGSWIIFSIPVAGPAFIGDYEVWKHSQLPHEPLLQQLLKIEPTVSGYPFFGFKNASPTLAVSLMAYAIFIFVFFIGGSVIYALFIYDSFIGLKKFMSIQTQKMQMVLFWAITVQLLTVTILLFLPFTIQYAVFLLQIRSGSIIAMSMFLSMNYHLFVEIIALGFFVKPYREYLINLWKKGTGKLRKRNEISSAAKIHSISKSTNDHPDLSSMKTKKSDVSKNETIL